MNIYFATREAEERRITLLRRAEEEQELDALRTAQPDRFILTPTLIERLVARLQHIVRRTKPVVQFR